MSGRTDDAHRTEAIAWARTHHNLPAAEYTDDFVWRLNVTQRAAVAFAVRDVRTAIIGSGPGRHTRRFLLWLSDCLGRAMVRLGR